MSDRLVRLENFRTVCKERGLGPTDLSAQLGSRYTYWRDLLLGEKAFGEKIARRIEEGLKLPRGWLDQAQPDGGEREEEAAATPSPAAEVKSTGGAFYVDRDVLEAVVFQCVAQGEPLTPAGRDMLRAAFDVLGLGRQAADRLERVTSALVLSNPPFAASPEAAPAKRAPSARKQRSTTEDR